MSSVHEWVVAQNISLIEYVAGIDIMKVYVNRILGDTSQIVKPVCSKKLIELNYVYAYNGIFTKLVGFNQFLKTGEIKELFQYKKEGSTIEKRITSSDRIVGFLIEASNIQELVSLRKRIVDNVDILNTDGASIMYKKCFY